MRRRCPMCVMLGFLMRDLFRIWGDDDGLDAPSDGDIIRKHAYCATDCGEEVGGALVLPIISV